MNQITFPRISYDGSIITKNQLEIWFCGQIENAILTRLKTISANSEIEKRVLKWLKNNLHYVLIASPIQLQKMTIILDSYIKMSTQFKTYLRSAFNYDKYRKGMLVDLAEKLDIKSCPYCNMQYTLFAEKGNRKSDKIAKMQFDHFYDKSNYPFLSMSLYNLIPSCGICNQGKSKGKLSLKFHPYYSDIYKQFRFEIADTLMLYVGAKKDKIDVELIPEKATTMELKEYQEVFNITTLYSRHRDIAQEAFDKAYEDAYYSQSSSFQFLEQNDIEYLQRLAIGVYPNETEIEKRPMSKFILDMRKQASKSI